MPNIALRTGEFEENMARAEKVSQRWIAGVEPPSELRKQSMTAIYEMECREQPARLAQVIDAYSEDKSILKELHELRQAAASCAPIVFAGMGASYCSSITGSTWLQLCGRSSFVVDASEWLHYARAVRVRVAASILVTTSGESAELIQLCKESARNPFALLCNNEASKCWVLAPIKLPILAGPEYGNATKTYTNSTAACIALATSMVGRTWRENATKVLNIYPDILNRVFDRRNELEEFCRGAANIEVMGRGPSFGGAMMGALCIREMSGNRAAYHTSGGFRHGPILDVNKTHVAIILALGREAALGVKLAHDCIARGGKVVLVSAEDYSFSERLLAVKIKEVPEPWEALTSVLVPQALTLGMIEKSGANLTPRFEYGVMEE
jgi:glutamine---fructose-6-phosphate transaminase (isomerizing)